MPIDRQVLISQTVKAARNQFLKWGGWRYADALYLIGGFARNEGTCDVVDGKLRIYNDLDLLAVVCRRDAWRLQGLHRVAHRMNDGRLGCHVDLIIRGEKDLLRPVKTIFHADIARSHICLWGESHLDRRERSIDLACNPCPGDALQLLLNRQSSLMIGLKMLHSNEPDIRAIQVQLSKPLLATMSACLVMEGQYVTPLVDQLEAVHSRAYTVGSSRLYEVFRDKAFMDHVRIAVRFKHDPRAEDFRPLDKTAREIAQGYYRYLRTYMAIHYDVLDNASIDDLISAMRKRQPRFFDLFSLGWWACWRAAGSISSFPRWPRWSVHPMVDVYSRQLKWMGRWLEGEVESDEPELSKLLSAWKVSGYGCHLR